MDLDEGDSIFAIPTGEFQVYIVIPETGTPIGNHRLGVRLDQQIPGGIHTSDTAPCRHHGAG